MSEAKDVKFSLKVMINKQKTKVLFAEADSDFADNLLSFLALPLGGIVRALEKHCGNEAPVVGSFTTLYKGLANLDNVHFWTEGGKKMLLEPRSSFIGEPIKYFRCGDRDCKRKRSSSPDVSIYYDTRKCDCGNPLSRPMGAIESKTQAADNGIFAKKRLSFLITDDLQMAPNEPGSVIQTLINLGITMTQGARLRNVTFGYKFFFFFCVFTVFLDQFKDLLKASLLSKTPLTDTILHKSSKLNRVTKDLQHQVAGGSSCNSKKIIVKAMLQKSTNKLLFVQAEEDFVDFLFSLLAIPLGGVECLLGNKTSLKNIDNLYRSIANLIDDKYLRTRDTRNKLLNPELPPKYLSKNQIFSLSEQMTPIIYYFESVTDSPNRTVEEGSWMCFKDPKGDEGSYVKQSGTFMVTDDLTVTPLSMSSSVFVRNELKIPISDVKELELHIALKEALSILKASLASTSTLTDGLINPILRKQPKQEQWV